MFDHLPHPRGRPCWGVPSGGAIPAAIGRQPHRCPTCGQDPPGGGCKLELRAHVMPPERVFEMYRMRANRAPGTVLTNMQCHVGCPTRRAVMHLKVRGFVGGLPPGFFRGLPPG